MNDRITMPFALTSIAFTGLFLLVWRIGFLSWHILRKIQRSSDQHNPLGHSS
jgi:hypothetical protein